VRADIAREKEEERGRERGRYACILREDDGASTLRFEAWLAIYNARSRVRETARREKRGAKSRPTDDSRRELFNFVERDVCRADAMQAP